MPISLEQIYYTYNMGRPDQRKALINIDLQFEDHCFTALIGRTGSGKSTLIQHLNGLLLPDCGILRVDDFTLDRSLIYKEKKGQRVVDVRKMKKIRKKKIKDVKSLRKKVGIVFQFPEYQLFEDNVLKDVAYGPKNFGKSDEDAIKMSKEALSLVGIDPSYYQRSPFELSGGEKRRVAIAGILALDPDVLVLDEPTVGLDAGNQENLMNLITSLYERGKSIIIATHDMDVVMKYCDRAVVFDHGKIVLNKAPLKLFQDEVFMSTSSLQPPKAIKFAMDLIRNGVDVKLENIKDIPTLAKEIARVKGVEK